jgi:hypothetical protein
MKLASRHPPAWRLEIWVGPDRSSVVREENTNLSLVGFSEKLVVATKLTGVMTQSTFLLCDWTLKAVGGGGIEFHTADASGPL